MNEMTTIARQVEWTSQVKLRGGNIGKYEGKCPVTKKHRVQTFKDVRGNPMPPPRPGDNTQYTYTTWLLDDNGKCRGDLADSPQDYLGPTQAGERA